MLYAMEVLIVRNSLSVSNVSGAVIAVLLAPLLSRIDYRAILVALLLSAALIVNGLSPFEFRIEPTAFNWLPFKGLLGGSMYINTLVICLKTFLFGSLVFFLWQTQINRAISLPFAVILVGGIEFFRGKRGAARRYPPNAGRRGRPVPPEFRLRLVSSPSGD